MTWELYEPPGARLLWVTIQRSGSLTISPAATRLLEQTDHVALLFDDQNNCIGIRAADGPEDNGLRLSGAEDKPATVTAKHFCEHFKIPLGPARRYRADWDHDDKMLVVSLTAPPLLPRPPRAGPTEPSSPA